MATDNRSFRNRGSEFVGSLCMQVRAALAVGLPAGEARPSVEPGVRGGLK